LQAIMTFCSERMNAATRSTSTLLQCIIACNKSATILKEFKYKQALKLIYDALSVNNFH